MPLPSSLPAQAASTAGSNRIAAIFADVPKCYSSASPVFRILLDRPAAKWNSHLGYRAALRAKTAPTHGHWGSNGAWAGSDPRALRGQCGSDGAREGSGSAALDGRDVLLDRQLRRGVRLHDTHVLVVAMMADMLVAHPRIGIECFRLGLVGLDDRRSRGLGGRRSGSLGGRRRHGLVGGR